MDTVGGIDSEELRRGLRGTVLLPREPGYDQARTVWNAMIDKRPALIVRCAGAADVRTAVDFARNSGCRWRCPAAATTLPAARW